MPSLSGFEHEDCLSSVGSLEIHHHHTHSNGIWLACEKGDQDGNTFLNRIKSRSLFLYGLSIEGLFEQQPYLG
jgi:hypothetical protein